MSTATKERKAIKPLTIIRREVENDTINYGILSGEKVYIATLKNGVPCNCKTENGSACSSYYFSKGNKHCKHTDEAIRNEQERGTDLQQHIADDVHTCCICSNRVSEPNTYCFGCLG